MLIYFLTSAAGQNAKQPIWLKRNADKMSGRFDGHHDQLAIDRHGPPQSLCQTDLTCPLMFGKHRLCGATHHINRRVNILAETGGNPFHIRVSHRIWFAIVGGR